MGTARICLRRASRLTSNQNTDCPNWQPVGNFVVWRGSNLSRSLKRVPHLRSGGWISYPREESRQLIEATGAIDKRYEWNENSSKIPIKKLNKKIIK